MASNFSNAGINNRPNQDLSFSLTLASPNVADSVPCIDTSIFTSLPADSFNELLQKYEDPVVAVSDTFSQTPLKENLTILPLETAQAKVPEASVENANALPNWPPCVCSLSDKGDEVPVEQVFIRNGQMYRLPEAGVVSLANMELNGFYRSNQWYVSLVVLHHMVGTEAKKLYQKALINPSDLDIMTVGDNELELLVQKTGLDIPSMDSSVRDLISIGCLQMISRSICEVIEIPVIRDIAYGDIYRKILGNDVRCSNCGLLVKKEPSDQQYELLWTQSAENTVINYGVPLSVGMIHASNAKFCGFQMNDKVYINLGEVVRFKMFHLPAIQRKLTTLGISPIQAPAGVEEQFDSGSTLLPKGMWLDLVNLRCVCCMGNGKCLVKGHSEEVWQALKMGKCTYEPGISFIAEDDSKSNALLKLPLNDSLKKMSPTSTVTLASGDEFVGTVGKPSLLGTTEYKTKSKANFNGSEEHVSSTTGDFVPATAQLGPHEELVEQTPEQIHTLENAIEFKIAEPSGEVIEVDITEIEGNDVNNVGVIEQVDPTASGGNFLTTNESTESIEKHNAYGHVELKDPVTKKKDDCNVARNLEPQNLKDEYQESFISQGDFQEYFIGRPRGRPTKDQEAFVFKSPVETSTKRGTMFLFPGDCIVPNLKELNRLIQCKKVIIGQKSLTKEVLTNENIAPKSTTAKICFRGKQNIKAKTKNIMESPLMQQKDKERKPISDSDNVLKHLETRNLDSCFKAATSFELAANEVINVNTPSNAEEYDCTNTQSNKVVIEYVKNKTDEETLTSEKELEKTEVCQNGMVQNKNTKSPEKMDTSFTMGFASPVSEKDGLVKTSLNTSDSFTSPGLSCYAQSGNIAKTPPSRRVERLAKLTASESFNRPDAALLTLAFAAEQDQEEEIDKEDSENMEEVNEEQNEVVIHDKTVNQANTEKYICKQNSQKDENQEDELIIDPLLNEQYKPDQQNRFQRKDGNQTSASTESLEERVLPKTLQQKDRMKIETILQKMKEYVVFAFDEKHDILKVKTFDERARADFPVLFAPENEELRTRFATKLSLYMTNNYHKLMLEKKRKSPECSFEEHREAVGPDSVLSLKDSSDHQEQLAKENPSLSNGSTGGSQNSSSGTSQCVKDTQASEAERDDVFDSAKTDKDLSKYPRSESSTKSSSGFDKELKSNGEKLERQNELNHDSKMNNSTSVTSPNDSNRNNSTSIISSEGKPATEAIKKPKANKAKKTYKGKGIDKIVIKKDKSGKHVLQKIDKPKSKLSHNQETIGKQESCINTGAFKSSVKLTGQNNIQSEHIMDSQIKLHEKGKTIRQTKPLKKMLIKMKFGRKSKAEIQTTGCTVDSVGFDSTKGHLSKSPGHEGLRLQTIEKPKIDCSKKEKSVDNKDKLILSEPGTSSNVSLSKSSDRDGQGLQTTEKPKSDCSKNNKIVDYNDKSVFIEPDITSNVKPVTMPTDKLVLSPIVYVAKLQISKSDTVFIHNKDKTGANNVSKVVNLQQPMLTEKECPDGEVIFDTVQTGSKGLDSQLGSILKGTIETGQKLSQSPSRKEYSIEKSSMVIKKSCLKSPNKSLAKDVLAITSQRISRSPSKKENSLKKSSVVKKTHSKSSNMDLAKDVMDTKLKNVTVRKQSKSPSNDSSKSLKKGQSRINNIKTDTDKTNENLAESPKMTKEEKNKITKSDIFMGRDSERSEKSPYRKDKNVNSGNSTSVRKLSRSPNRSPSKNNNDIMAGCETPRRKLSLSPKTKRSPTKGEAKLNTASKISIAITLKDNSQETKHQVKSHREHDTVQNEDGKRTLVNEKESPGVKKKRKLSVTESELPENKKQKFDATEKFVEVKAVRE